MVRSQGHSPHLPLNPVARRSVTRGMNCTRRRLQKHRRAALRTPPWRSDGTALYRWNRALALVETTTLTDGMADRYPTALGASELASFVGSNAVAVARLAGAPPWFVTAVARRAEQRRLADELSVLVGW